MPGVGGVDGRGWGGGGGGGGGGEGEGKGRRRDVTDLVVKLSLACMFNLFSSTIQLLILSPDLVVARLIVLGHAGVLCLHRPHFSF